MEKYSETYDPVPERPKLDWAPVLRLLPWILLIPVGIAVPFFCSGRPEVFERYATEIYPGIKDALSSITSLVPVSVAEAIVYALVLGIPVLLITRLIPVLKRKASPVQYVCLVEKILIAAGIVWILFYATWGFNYFRSPLKERMGLDVKPVEVQKLYELTKELAEKTSEARELVPEDGEGVFCLQDPDVSKTFQRIPDAYRMLSEAYPVFSGKVTPAKPVSWSEGLSWSGISGIYIGLTAEPNVNVDQPTLLIPCAAAHEEAHQLGIASENEAELAGTLACLYSTSPAVVYSGLANALIHCGNALVAASPELYEKARAFYSEKVLLDFRSYNAYWDRYEGKVEETVTEMNDSYLKHNAQESGVRGYGEVVDLLLALREQQNFLDSINIF